MDPRVLQQMGGMQVSKLKHRISNDGLAIYSVGLWPNGFWFNIQKTHQFFHISPTNCVKASTKMFSHFSNIFTGNPKHDAAIPSRCLGEFPRRHARNASWHGWHVWWRVDCGVWRKPYGTWWMCLSSVVSPKTLYHLLESSFS